MFLHRFRVLAVGVLFLATAVLTAAETRDGVFIHLSHGPENPHRVLMALNMANLMAQDHPVLVYLDVEAVKVVVRGAADLEMAPFKSSSALLRSLLEKKARVMACPSCLAVAGKTARDLIEGVEVADKAAFFQFTEGRIISLDY